MKHIKIGLILIAPVMALMLLGNALQPPRAEAFPQTIVTINPNLCLVLSASNWSSTQDALTNCSTLGSESSLRAVVEALGGDPDSPTPEDFASIDMDGGMMHEEDGKLFILAFVSNDEPVGFFADRGIFSDSGASSAACGPLEPSFDFQDEDCDDDGVDGDGVVVASLVPNGAPRGEAEVRVRQQANEIAETYKIVGEPHDLSIAPSKSIVQIGVPTIMPPGADEGTARCLLFSDTATFLGALGDPETTPLLTTVFDDDGTAISGAFLDFTISNPDGAVVALPFAPSLDLSSSLGQVTAPNVLCGYLQPGDITVTATITIGPLSGEEPIGLDPQANLRTRRVEMTVVDKPSEMVLSASPASLTCDGINSSTISATLTDPEGNPAVNGNRVHWQVKALGSVAPLNSTSAAGAATTVLTPLAGVTGGVVVRAWVEFPEAVQIVDPTPTPPGAGDLPPVDLVRSDIERTLLVACEGAPAPGQPGGPAGPSIQPPSTGTGGGPPSQVWLAVPLGIAALLTLGGLALKRRAA